jgi:hypothetical protein
MTSQAQAHASLPGVQGLAFVGFPLHPKSISPACEYLCFSFQERATRLQI